ncbi:MAG: hypothetical protein NUV86_07660 [Candidatus Scalindua sp.]|nr:hypothetical protein [Candidatus Scalindua sp.]MCR4344360.1 hypothetical protein [Candidatus Scalindua sp.]
MSDEDRRQCAFGWFRLASPTRRSDGQAETTGMTDNMASWLFFI